MPVSTFNSSNKNAEKKKKTPKINWNCGFFTIEMISLPLLSMSGQSDTSPLRRQSPSTTPRHHHHLEVTLGRIPLSTKPTKQQPSHHAIVQPNSTGDRYKRTGGRLSRAERVCDKTKQRVWRSSCPAILAGTAAAV